MYAETYETSSLLNFLFQHAFYCQGGGGYIGNKNNFEEGCSFSFFLNVCLFIYLFVCFFVGWLASYFI